MHPTFLKLRVELRYVTPQVWRSLAVPDSLTLGALHLVIQAAYGWTNSHLHDFRTLTKRYCQTSFDAEPEDLSEDDITLGAVLQRKGAKMVYTYDFGDCWEHLITREGGCSEAGLAVLDGAGACPPEDCGGFPGYLHFLEAINDARHPEHAQMVDWAGVDSFDPLHFDLAAANLHLAELLAPPQRARGRSAVKRRGSR